MRACKARRGPSLGLGGEKAESGAAFHMSKVKKVFRALRLGEVTILTGFFLIGALFAVDKIDILVLRDLALIIPACVFLLLSIYSFNAFCGKRSDSHNERLDSLKEISGPGFGLISLLFLGASLVAGLSINKEIPFYILAITFLGVIYSLPKFGLKNFPPAGTLVHFLWQVINFHLVYCVFQPPSLRSFLISLYFALLISAGHVHHEVIDFRVDMESLSKTGASVLGLRKAKILEHVLFSSAAGYWIFLFSKDWISPFELPVFLAPYVAQTAFFLRYHRNFHTPLKGELCYRKVYRFAYFGAGVVLAVYKVLGFHV